jgi:hypothetical protein
MNRLERRAHRKEERETHIAQQRDQFRKRQRNKRIFNYTIIGIIVIALAYGLYVGLKSEPGQHDELAQCLTAKGAVMYGTDWCPHCQDQKRMFGESFRYVTYVNCDRNQALPECQEGYPNWVFPQGPSMPGVQPLATLKERTEC